VGDDGGVVEADVAAAEGVLGVGEVGEAPGEGEALGGGAAGEAAAGDQPGDGGGGALGGGAVEAVEAVEAAGVLGLEAVDLAAEGDEVVAESGGGEVVEVLAGEGVDGGGQGGEGTEAGRSGGVDADHHRIVSSNACTRQPAAARGAMPRSGPLPHPAAWSAA
jgi:hypothetical protein